MKTFKLILITLHTTLFITAQTDTIDYFGQTPPGDSAVIFAPSIISLDNRWEGKITFSSDGKECYFEGNAKIFYTNYVNNSWSEQVEASFSVNHNTCSPFLSVNSNRLYFNYWSNDWANGDIWMVERTTGGWGEPKLLPSPINLASIDYGYTETADSIAYIISGRPGGLDTQHGDIWCIRRLPDQSLLAENLGTPVNSIWGETDQCISADGSYIIFSTMNNSIHGLPSLYISFNKGNNEWTTPLDMNRCGKNININTYVQNCPYLSPDGKYLFFSRNNNSDKSDIYWVSTSIIPKLKKIAFAPRLANQIPNITITIDSTLNYVVPENTFSCEQVIDSLKFSATLSDGSVLPGWLDFNPKTRTLSGSPTQADTNDITITASYADTSASCTFKIEVTSSTGVNQTSSTKLKVYPNPAQNTLQIEYIGLSQKKVNYKIVDLSGKTLQVGKLRGNTIDVSKISKGIYILKIEIDDKILSRKFVLQ